MRKNCAMEASRVKRSGNPPRVALRFQQFKNDGYRCEKGEQVSLKTCIFVLFLVENMLQAIT